ncbi:MAG: CpaD family pilus assembly lipoprotein [Alphaproteobacteria bacterium]
MTRSPGRRIGLLIAASLVLLSACSRTDAFHQAELPRTSEVTFVHFVYPVDFTPGTTFISVADETKLAVFVSTLTPGAADRFWIVADGNSPLERSRSMSLAALLGRTGIQAPIRPRQGGQSAGPDTGNSLTLVVERAIVTPPHCGHWPKPSGGDSTNQPLPLGCANASNLALMIADPRHLLFGSAPGAASAIQGSAAVGRYFNGTTYPLLDASTGSQE